MAEKVLTAMIITRREIRDQFRDWRIIIPILLLTLIFPALMNFTAEQAVNFVEDYGATIIGDRLIPFLLMIVGFFPTSVSLVIALESFVGEKERRSIEPLLSTPLSDWQLYVGKLLAVLVPPLLASFLGISVYLVGVYRQVGWTPEPILLIQIVLLTIVQSLVMVSGAVVISSQATSVRAANLLASFIIIPMAFLIQGESLVMFWGRYNVLWWAIFGLVVLSGLLVRTGVAHFNREELLGRELDSLNWGWGLKTFREVFVGRGRSILSWYRDEIRPTMRDMRRPLAMMVLLLFASIWLGIVQAGEFVLPPEALSLQDFQDGSIDQFQFVSLFSTRGILTIWLHNIRAIVLAMLLGVFSFGVFGLITLLLAPFLVGYLMATVAAGGISPAVFLTAFILPHGIFEIPAILIAGAAILKMGASLATPAQGKSIGEAWLRSFANWVKIMVAVVVPLLLIAAAVEALVTPRIAFWFLSQ
jgi:uncharacterized membrane protein SpoIIM required for sporulation/ABC-type transport system involved in multi-copper enzyme maturation permease subunit